MNAVLTVMQFIAVRLFLILLINRVYGYLFTVVVQPCVAIFRNAPAHVPVPEIFTPAMPGMRIAAKFYRIAAG
jgi:hypothetical protein